MPRLFITAKYSAARAIGAALAGKAGHLEKKADHFEIKQRDGRVSWITWCGGHLLEMAPPEFYDSRYHKWHLEDLPIIPSCWKWVERNSNKQTERGRQLKFICNAVKKASMVVHAGDPDREGQWLIDELLVYTEYTGPVQRLLLNSMNERLVKNSIKQFEASPPDNQTFKSLTISARTRSCVDWLYGMNMTRAYTLLGRHAGYKEVLSVGRIQSPLLALVVKRDDDIEGFVGAYHYDLEAKFRKGEEFCYARLRATEDALSEQTEESLKIIMEKLRGKDAKLEKVETEHHVQAPPLLLDLASLQIECAENLGYSGVEVIKIARSLYEDHHLITYPLTDCRYAPDRLRQEAEAVLDSVLRNFKTDYKHLKDIIQGVDVWRQSAAWNDARLTQHHGIVPTAHELQSSILTEQEKNVYELIVRFYITQFLPDAEAIEHRAVFCVEGCFFDFYQKLVTHQGWNHVFYENDLHPENKIDMLNWSSDARVQCEDLDIKRHKIRPPPRFTEASLISAMSAGDGMGTEVSRAYMIDTLFKRGYLIKGNKSIYSSGVGRDLVRALPAEAISIDNLASWEGELSRIAHLPPDKAEASAKHFLREVEEKVSSFIHEAKTKHYIPLASPEDILGMEQKPKHRCPECHAVLSLRTGRYGSFWGCTAFPSCTYTTKHIKDS